MKTFSIVNGQSAASDATSTIRDMTASSVPLPFQPNNSAVAVFTSDGLAGATIYLEGNLSDATMTTGNVTLASFLVAEAPAKFAEITIYPYMRVRVDELTSTGAGVVSVNLLQN